MVRGFVYSFVAICIFLIGSIAYMTIANITEERADLLGGMLLLLCFFLVGPVFFAIGYWHHFRLTPDKPHWDPELGE